MPHNWSSDRGASRQSVSSLMARQRPKPWRWTPLERVSSGWELSRWSMGFHGDFIQFQDDGEPSVTDEDQSPMPDRPFPSSDTAERMQSGSVAMPSMPQQPLRERGSGPSLDIFPVYFERDAAQLIDDFSVAPNQPALTPTEPVCLPYSPLQLDQHQTPAATYTPTPLQVLRGW